MAADSFCRDTSQARAGDGVNDKTKICLIVSDTSQARAGDGGSQSEAAL